MKHPCYCDNPASYRLNLRHSICHVANVSLSDPAIEAAPFVIHHCNTARGRRIGVSAREEDDLIAWLGDLVGRGEVVGHDCKMISLAQSEVLKGSHTDPLDCVGGHLEGWDTVCD